MQMELKDFLKVTGYINIKPEITFSLEFSFHADYSWDDKSFIFKIINFV